jgi:glucose/arabinose dehydrogenase
MKLTKIAAVLTTLLVFMLGACGAQANRPPPVKLQLIEDGFTSPVALVAPRDGSQRLFVVDQTGLIWIITNGKRLEKPFLAIRARVVKLNDFYDERGLLGLAFHPDFATNGRFYVS